MSFISRIPTPEPEPEPEHFQRIVLEELTNVHEIMQILSLRLARLEHRHESEVQRRPETHQPPVRESGG